MKLIIHTKKVTNHRTMLFHLINIIKSKYCTHEVSSTLIKKALFVLDPTKREPFGLNLRKPIHLDIIINSINEYLDNYYKNRQHAQTRITTQYVIDEIDKTISFFFESIENKKEKKISKAFNPDSDTSIAEKLLRLKISAEKRNIDFEVSFKKLKQLSKITRCQITGEELTFEADQPNSRSIDRIDNTKGYIDNNICVTSVHLNKAKDNLTLKEIVALYMFIKRKKLI